MSESTAEEESAPDDQENEGAPGIHGAGPPCVTEEAHGVIPHQETHDSDSSIPDEFGDDV